MAFYLDIGTPKKFTVIASQREARQLAMTVFFIGEYIVSMLR